MLNDLTLKKDIQSFSVSPENVTGEKGNGGRAVDGMGANAARELGIGWKISPCVPLQNGETITLANIKGQGAIKHIWITTNSQSERLLILRIYFDGQKKPAVCTPLSDFFCNTDSQEYRQISSLPICCNPRKGLNCYFEMPYFREFRIELENLGSQPCSVFYQIDCEKKQIPENSLYFHACFRRINPLPYLEVYPILNQIQGCGQYVGTYLHWGVKSNGWWGEGEIKFYIDGDTDFPTICGTGTEDYFCGSYDFEVDGKYIEFDTLYTGLSKVNRTDDAYRSQRYFDMYRWHITDPVYFKKDLRITIQALGWRSDKRYLPLQDDISSVAYWYSDNLEDDYGPAPTANELELIK